MADGIGTGFLFCCLYKCASLLVALRPLLPWWVEIHLLGKASHDGNFTVKYAYYHCVQFPPGPPDPLFRLIWRWKGMEQIRTFLWQVASGSLPTNHFRWVRHITTSL